MEYILFQAFLTLLNAILAIYTYREKQYKTAIFCGFTAAICFMGLLNARNLYIVNNF